MKRIKLILLVLVPFFAIGCGKSTYNRFDTTGGNNPKVLTNPVSANDVAFLFPLDANDRPTPLVTLASAPEIPGNGNFQRVVDAARADGVFFQGVLEDPDEWAMVSFRYSPCINFAGTQGPCKEQIRFVYQPMDPAGAGFLDFSLHVTYEYNASDSAQASDIMNAFVDVRDSAGGATDGLSLGVHPVLGNGADGLAYFNEIRTKIWTPFVFDRNPKATTFMGLGVDANDNTQVNLGEWIFLFGLINANGEWEQQTLPDGSGQDFEVLGISQDPATAGTLISSVNSGVEFNILEGGAVSEVTAANILTPQISNEHNVNCASCHVVDNQVLREDVANNPARLDTRNFDFDQFANQLLNNIGEQQDGFTNNLISNDLRGGTFTLADGIPQDGPVAPEQEVVTRMFGYMHRQPVVSQRMAFDNGMAVNAINQVLGAEQLSASNVTCNEFTAQVNVLSCLLESGFSTSLDQCVQQSCN